MSQSLKPYFTDLRERVVELVKAGALTINDLFRSLVPS